MGGNLFGYGGTRGIEAPACKFKFAVGRSGSGYGEGFIQHLRGRKGGRSALKASAVGIKGDVYSAFDILTNNIIDIIGLMDSDASFIFSFNIFIRSPIILFILV